MQGSHTAGIRSGRCAFRSVPKTLRKRPQSSSAWHVLSRGPCLPSEFQPREARCFLGVVVSVRGKGLKRRGVGVTRTTTPGVPRARHGAFALDGLSRQEPRIRGPGKPAAAGGGSARARWAGPVLFCPNHCKQAEAGRGGNGAPAAGQGGSAGGGGRGGRVSARRRRLQRSRRSLGGRHWSVAGSGRLRGSRRCGAVPVRAVVWRPASRPRLSGGMLGSGSRARNWGWGAWLPLLLFSGKAAPHPPSLLLLGVGHAACPRGLPECSRLCPGLLREPGTIREPSWFLGASRPRGICASHTWPELRRGPGFPQPSGLRVAPGLATCPRAGQVESGSSSCCCPRPVWGRGALLVAEVLVSGFSGSGRPELEFRTPYSRELLRQTSDQPEASWKSVDMRGHSRSSDETFPDVQSGALHLNATSKAKASVDNRFPVTVHEED
ncbi:hypothetical protein LEMLEM_LOCUS18955 [Lemmus lemmus]